MQYCSICERGYRKEPHICPPAVLRRIDAADAAAALSDADEALDDSDALPKTFTERVAMANALCSGPATLYAHEVLGWRYYNVECDDEGD